MDNKQPFQSGIAALVGRTNAGKSTLLNALVGTKVAIVTPRPQTTRDTYHAVVHRPNGQIVLVDTPGVFATAGGGALVRNLHRRIDAALEDLDIVLHVVDPSREPGCEDEQATKRVAAATQPKILCLNKSDMIQRPFREYWLQRQTGYNTVVEVSALRRTNLDALIDACLALLPEGPEYYPDNQVSNMGPEHRMAELIREQVYLLTGQEIPYTTTVQVESIKDSQDKQGTPLLDIRAVILTTDDRRQRMLIGRGARKVKQIGIAARHSIEAVFGKKAFLDLTVLVDPHWIERMP